MGLDWHTMGRSEFGICRDAWNRVHETEGDRPPADVKRLQRMMTVH